MSAPLFESDRLAAARSSVALPSDVRPVLLRRRQASTRPASGGLEPVGQNNFDALRLVLAIAVIYAHAFTLSRGTKDPLYGFSFGQTDAGGTAVIAFFGVSGYLIAMSCARSRSAGLYLRRRAARIFPGFAVALAFTALLVGRIARSDATPFVWRTEIARLGSSAIKLSPWIDVHAFTTNVTPSVVNASLWTIRYEFACYVLLLAIALAGGLRRPARLAAVAACVYAANVAFHFGLVPLNERTIAGLSVSPMFGLLWGSAFLAGAVAWTLRERLAFRPLAAACLAVTFAIACRLPGVHGYALVAPIAVPYVALTLAFLPCPPMANLSRRIGGDYSYGLYLYACPIQQLITLAFGGRMDPLLNAALATIAATGCGVLSWHLLEKHFIAHRTPAATAIAAEVPAPTGLGLIPPGDLAEPCLAIDAGAAIVASVLLGNGVEGREAAIDALSLDDAVPIRIEA